MNKETLLKKQMLDESRLITKTVDFLEIEINKHLGMAEFYSLTKNEKSFEKEKGKVNMLLGLLSAEILNMDAFMLKYRKIVKNEKKKMLFTPREKKQIHVRGIPKNKRR